MEPLNGWLVAGAMALALVSGGLGYLAGESDAEAVCVAQRAQDRVIDQAQVIEKQTEYRQEEGRRDAVVESVSRETTAAAADTASSAGVSAEHAERLYDQLEASKRQYRSSVATCDARLAQQREAAAAQYELLADLYRESDRAAGARAAEAESYRTAGLACEAIYDGVRQAPK